MSRVVDIRDARARRLARRGKAGCWRFDLDAEGQFTIKVIGPNGLVDEEQTVTVPRDGSERIIKHLSRKLAALHTAEWRAKNPLPPPHVPKWKRCAITPTGRKSRGSTSCLRRDGHDGEHRDRSGTTFNVVACIHPKPWCRVSTGRGGFWQCNECGAVLGRMEHGT